MEEKIPAPLQSEETRYSHYRTAYTKQGYEVHVPVMDVRDGWVARAIARQMARSGNQSRYISYNQYHQSPKKQKEEGL